MRPADRRRADHARKPFRILRDYANGIVRVPLAYDFSKILQQPQISAAPPSPSGLPRRVVLPQNSRTQPKPLPLPRRGTSFSGRSCASVTAPPRRVATRIHEGANKLLLSALPLIFNRWAAPGAPANTGGHVPWAWLTEAICQVP